MRSFLRIVLVLAVIDWVVFVALAIINQTPILAAASGIPSVVACICAGALAICGAIDGLKAPQPQEVLKPSSQAAPASSSSAGLDEDKAREERMRALLK